MPVENEVDDKVGMGDSEDIQSHEIQRLADIDNMLADTPVAAADTDTTFMDASNPGRPIQNEKDEEDSTAVARAEEFEDEDDDDGIEIDVMTKSAEELENVSELCMSLSACHLGTTLALHNRTVHKAPDSSKTKDSKWLAEPLWPMLSEINEHNIQTGLFALAQVNSPNARLCSVSGMGWELEGGIVEVGRAGGIIFDSSCDNGVVNGVIFRGGLLITACNSISAIIAQFL
jgi:hypothetical protein